MKILFRICRVGTEAVFLKAHQVILMHLLVWCLWLIWSPWYICGLKFNKLIIKLCNVPTYSFFCKCNLISLLKKKNALLLYVEDVLLTPCFKLVSPSVVISVVHRQMRNMVPCSDWGKVKTCMGLWGHDLHFSGPSNGCDLLHFFRTTGPECGRLCIVLTLIYWNVLFL